MSPLLGIWCPWSAVISMKARVHLFTSLDVNRRMSKCVSECSNFSNTIQKHPRAGHKWDCWRSAAQLCISLPSDPREHPVKCCWWAWSGDGCVKRGDIDQYCQLLEMVLLNSRNWRGEADLREVPLLSQQLWERTARDKYPEGGITLQWWAEHGEVKELFARVPAVTHRNWLPAMTVKENLVPLGLQVLLQFG